MPFPSSRDPAPTPHVGDGSFVILAVCSGNVCRSPLLEHHIRSALLRELGAGSQGSVVVSSAGTIARAGQAMDALALAEADRLGHADAHGHRARRLTRDDVAAADLVLGLERSHRGAAVTAEPTALRRSFTLLELGRIVHRMLEERQALPVGPVGGSDVVAGLRAIVDRAATVRGMMPAGEVLDVEDPMGRSPATHRATADLIARSTDLLAKDLGLLMRGRTG